jgi:hypothetical protein
MTPARTHAHGLASPSLCQLSLTALLCVIAELVHRVAAMLGMRNRRQVRECDTIQMPEALPQAKRDIQEQEADSSSESFSGLSRESLLENAKGLAADPRESANRDARPILNKNGAEHGTLDAAHTLAASPHAPQARASSFDRLRMRRSLTNGRKGIMLSLSKHEAVLTTPDVSPLAPA